jgi:hypothetical protein
VCADDTLSLQNKRNAARGPQVQSKPIPRCGFGAISVAGQCLCPDGSLSTTGQCTCPDESITLSGVCDHNVTPSLQLEDMAARNTDILPLCVQEPVGKVDTCVCSSGCLSTTGPSGCDHQEFGRCSDAAASAAVTALAGVAAIAVVVAGLL